MRNQLGEKIGGRLPVVFAVIALVLTVTTGALAADAKVAEKNQNDDEYDDDENKICSSSDPGWLEDPDDDGEVDCVDNDDDGDYLTDEFEDDDYKGYDMGDADNDEDGSDDSFDIRPNGLEPTWTITAWDYNAPFEGEECETSFQKYPDPYLDQFVLSLEETADYNLEIPTDWSEENHDDNRDPGSVSDLTVNSVDETAIVDGQFVISNDIRDFGTTELDQPPSISLRIGLMDHDPDADDRMDLVDGSGVKADLDHELVESSKKPSDKGDGTCWGKIQFKMSDNVFQKWVCTALYHHNNPDELITTETDTSC